MAKEQMVNVVWPNGYQGAVRKSMAERLLKKKEVITPTQYKEARDKSAKEVEATIKAKAKAKTEAAEKDNKD